MNVRLGDEELVHAVVTDLNSAAFDGIKALSMKLDKFEYAAISPLMPLNAKSENGPPLIFSSTDVAFGVRPPIAAPVKFNSGTYDGCCSSAHSDANAPPE